MRTQALFFACCLFIARPDRAASARAHSDAALLVDDAVVLERLEQQGYAFNDVVSPAKRRAFIATLTDDVREFTGGFTPEDVRRPFQMAWLERGRFELVGVVNRFDRRLDPADAPSCGEVRLVYRLALHNPGRPPTRLPMTINVRIPQPLPARVRAFPGCREIAARWRAETDVLAILRDLPPFTKLETNFQSIHVPSYRLDMDDNAEYVMRSFKAEGDSLVPDTLTNTPREDLTPSEVADLVTWIRRNVAAIDAGTALVPDEFLATRSVSVSPRGLLHLANRQFSRHIVDPTRAFADVPLGAARLTTTPELLLRRLDESTCVGCHQSRGVAGFHLLGEERDRNRTFNALAVGHSPHLAAELPWRAEVLAAALSESPSPAAVRPRPFSGRPEGPGSAGTKCGLDGAFASWTCAPGLVCRDLQKGSLGVCVTPAGGGPGDACESVTTQPSTRAEGPTVTSDAPDPSCPPVTKDNAWRAFCAPNWLGFTGGTCSKYCKQSGQITGDAICAPLRRGRPPQAPELIASNAARGQRGRAQQRKPSVGSTWLRG